MSLFGKPKTAKDIARESQKQIRHNQRDMDRELLQLDRDEKKVTLEIKQLAKANQGESAKVLAKELIRIRKQREKVLLMKGQLSSANTKTVTMVAQQSMVKSMHGATRAMMATNAAVPAQAVQRTMMQFQKQNEISDVKSEMMDDAFDLDGEDEELADEAVQAVYDSIGLEVSDQMSKAKTGAALGEKQSAKTSDKDLEHLLASMPTVQ